MQHREFLIDDRAYKKIWYQVIPFIWMQSKFLFERSLREEESQVNSERGAELI